MTTLRRIGGSLAMGTCALALFCTLAKSGWTTASAAVPLRPTDIRADLVPEGSYQLWSDVDAPVVPDSGPDKPVELGVRWMSDTAGNVTALRFYKSRGNDGKHVGHLWTEAGHMLASGVFRNETPSGWQTARLPRPVAIKPGRIYVASYHAAGHYAFDAGYFVAARVRGPLLAPENGVLANGVFGYGPSGTFPTHSYNASNYWVDVMFEVGADPAPAGVAAVLPVSGDTAVARSTTLGRAPDSCPCTLFGSTVPAVIDGGEGEPVELGLRWRSDVDGVISLLRFYKAATDQGPHEGHLWTADGRLLATVGFDNETASGWQQAPLPHEVTVSAGTTYVASYHSKTGHYSYNSAYFTAPRSVGPLSAAGAQTANGLFSYGPSGSFPSKSHNATNYWVDVVFEARRRKTSTTRITAPSVDDEPDGSVAADTCPCTLFGLAVPATVDAGPDVAAELGVRFTSAEDGFITGIRFYKSAANDGPHVAHLWAPDGELLARASSTAETLTGWQEVMFAKPYAVRPNTTYTASYSVSNGHYSFTVGGFTSAVVAGPLRATADSEGANGVFRYGSTMMPTSSFRAANYWVDVIFVRPQR